MSARDIARSFLERIGARDVQGALALAAPGADVHILPLKLKGRMETEGRRYLEELISAVPDLRVEIPRLFAGSDGTVVAEVTIKGVQAAAFFGVVTERNFLDLEQLWFLHVREGRIHELKTYWCFSMPLAGEHGAGPDRAHQRTQHPAGRW